MDSTRSDREPGERVAKDADCKYARLQDSHVPDLFSIKNIGGLLCEK